MNVADAQPDALGFATINAIFTRPRRSASRCAHAALLGCCSLGWCDNGGKRSEIAPFRPRSYVWYGVFLIVVDYVPGTELPRFKRSGGGALSHCPPLQPKKRGAIGS